MFEQKILFYKFFSSSKNVEDINCCFLPFLNGATGPFRGQSSLSITSFCRNNINKLIKHKIFTKKFSFQKFKKYAQ